MSDVAPERAEQVRRVLELIESGKSENASCLEVGINRATFRAAALRAGAGDSYARALEGLAADQVEKLEQAIEDMREGRIDAQQARVEIDARKWFASKFLPKRYGDKVTNEHTGPDGGPLQLADATTEAIDARIQALLGQS